MAEPIKFTVTESEEGLWANVQPPLRNFDDAAINDILRWVLQQMNFGHFIPAADADGRLTSLTLGRPAAADPEKFTVDEYGERMRGRLMSVNFAGVLARAREAGVSPKHQELSETARATATDGAYSNTEMHYAFELLDILAGIRENTFVFTAPPIDGVAKPEVLAILREATRAYLFRQYRSCVTLCRALVEAALKTRITKEDVVAENRRTGDYMGPLERLIEIAIARAILSPEMGQQAHDIRTLGNDVLHQRTEPEPQRVWAVLLDTRAIVEAIYSQPLK
jgi:hypothetical protein